MTVFPPCVTAAHSGADLDSSTRPSVERIATDCDSPARRRHRLRSQPVDNPVYNSGVALGTDRGTTHPLDPATWGQPGTTSCPAHVIPRPTSLSSGVLHSFTGRRHAVRTATTQVIHTVHTPYDYNDRWSYGEATHSLLHRPTCGRPAIDPWGMLASPGLAGTCPEPTRAALGHPPTPRATPSNRGCDMVRPCPTGVPSVRAWVVRGSMSHPYVGATVPGSHPSDPRTPPARCDRSDPT